MNEIEKLSMGDGELLYHYIAELAKKFRWETREGKDVRNFTTEIKRFTMEWDRDNLKTGLDILIFDSFKQLFDSYESGLIKEYELPEEEFFVSKDIHDRIIKEAVKLQAAGEFDDEMDIDKL